MPAPLDTFLTAPRDPKPEGASGLQLPRTLPTQGLSGTGTLHLQGNSQLSHEGWTSQPKAGWFSWPYDLGYTGHLSEAPHLGSHL